MGKVRVVALGIVVLTASVALASWSPVAAGDAAEFEAPIAHGVVDFGDHVAYRLDGSACPKVQVEVTTKSATIGGPTEHGCTGHVAVPGLHEVKASGWVDGAPIEVAVVAGSARLPLRFQRIEPDQGKPVAGSPEVVSAKSDPRGGRRAVSMNTGDIVKLGGASLKKIASMTVRSAGSGSYELRTGSPDGPAVATGNFGEGPGGGSSPQNGWTMTAVPVTGSGDGKAGEPTNLFLAVTDAPDGPALVNYIDLNGTGIALPYRFSPDPPGTEVLFDGSSFDGWEHVGPGGFVLDHGAMRAQHQPGDVGWGWLWYSEKQFNDFVLRLRFRVEDLNDNGGVLIHHDDPLGNPWTPIVNADEVQIYDPGEQFTGGIAHIKDAERLATNSPPDWNQLEIKVVGWKWSVRINGRKVDRYSQKNSCGTNLEDCNDEGYIAVENERFDQTETDQGGVIWYDDIRIYECKGPKDRYCS